MGVTKDPGISLRNEVIPLVEIRSTEMAYVSISSYLLNRAVMSDHNRFSVKVLSELGGEKIASGDVPSNEIDGAKLPETFPAPDNPEVIHPLPTLIHGFFVIAG